MFNLKSKKMKKFILSLVVLCCLTAFTTTKAVAWPTISGNVKFSFTLIDQSWSNQSYDIYVAVVAGGQSTGWVYYNTVIQPNIYGPISFPMLNIPYPAPIDPETYVIWIKAVRSDGLKTVYGRDYGYPSSYSPFVLQETNSSIIVQ